MSNMKPSLPAADRQRLLGKFRQRNTTIRHSLRIMREQIPDPKAEIEFISTEANVETETVRGVSFTKSSEILLRFRVDDEEWVLPGYSNGGLRKGCQKSKDQRRISLSCRPTLPTGEYSFIFFRCSHRFASPWRH